MEALKITEKIVRENTFEHKKKETGVKFNPRLSANQPLNNWAQRFSFVFGTDYANPVKLLLTGLHHILIKQQSQTVWRFNKDSGSDTSGTHTKILDYRYMFFTQPKPYINTEPNISYLPVNN